jgi:uncharacterized protein DUF4062
MKVFLSSTVEGLRDARLSLIERIERVCENRVTLVCYERDGPRYPTLTPEETCLTLLRKCKAIIILIDQYYGTPCKAAPGISVTHAELREALKRGLIVIPVVRTQTWHEYAVCRANAGRPVSYAHVKEPRLFEMLEEIYSTCNCHVYENLTGEEAMSEIAAALDSVISGGATGTIQHVTLPAEESAPPAVPKTSSASVQVPHFADGQVLRVDELNSLSRTVVEVANIRGLQLAPAVTWANGQALTAVQLNVLLGDVARIYTHCSRTPPGWSFGQFEDGRVLRASHLNEIGDSLRALL